VVIVGAGKGGRALLEMFVGDPTISIVGVADVSSWAPGLEFARRHGIPVATDYRELVRDSGIDLVIDVTGDPDVPRGIQEVKAPTTEVMGGLGARFMWDLVAERKKKQELEGRYSLIVRELQAQAHSDFILGQSPKMREVGELIPRVAPTTTAVLIRGESGTGKELVARAIHRQSTLRDRPLLTVNCTALTPTAIDSELFGHRRGAFAGARADRVGLLEKADGATIFLDEIGDIPPETQAKVTRVLRGGEIRPVGDVVTRRVRVRVIAATNRDLETAVRRGEFRDDLFRALSACTIILPPLRERLEDLPVLAYHFLRKAEAKVNKRVESIGADALDLLKRYEWPGNLRELENVIERAVVLTADSALEAAHLPLHLQESPVTASLAGGMLAARDRVAREFERQALVRLLRQSQGNISEAARLAGTTRRNLHRLLHRYAIDAAGFRREVHPSRS
jgi:transcriptional regulator with GAF, ATPase, and Fis domain